MRSLAGYGYVFLWLLIGFAAAAQTNNQQKQEIIQRITERWIENNEALADYTDMLAQLEYCYDHKINLNTSTRDELQVLVFLSQAQIEALLHHREEFGNYLGLQELQVIDALDEQSLYFLRFFVSTDDARDFSLSGSYRGQLNILMETDLHQRKGYDVETLKKDSKEYYLGTPMRYVLRYRQQIGKQISIGFNAEKDKGEQFFAGAQQGGFDFNSGYVQLRDWKNFKQLIIGDYQANFGQGLTFGSGLAARKSAYVLNVLRFYQNTRPYNSVNENNFLRGLTVTYQYKAWLFTPFVSMKYLNTNYRFADSTDMSSSGDFSSVALSGLHRTQNEIQNKSNVLQRIYGIHLFKVFKKLQWGITAQHTDYSVPFSMGSKAYQLYNFSGTQLRNIGTDYRFIKGTLILAGEFSASDNGALAATNSILVSLDERMDVCLTHRHFDKTYQTTYNNPFAENSDGRNEEGFYIAAALKPVHQVSINTFFDLYRSSWLRYLVDAPAAGSDFLCETQWSPSKNFTGYIRFRQQLQPRNLPGESKLPGDVVVQQNKQQLRFHAHYKINDLLSSESRFEQSWFATPSANEDLIVTRNFTGTMAYQDFSMKLLRGKIRVSARIAVFDVDDYNARIYAFEDNVPYSFSVPLFQNRGTRFYVMSSYSPTKNLELFLRYAQTTYSNLKTISTGLEQIEGNTISDVKVQLNWIF